MVCFGLIQKGNNATLIYNNMVFTNESDNFSDLERWNHTLMQNQFAMINGMLYPDPHEFKPTVMITPYNPGIAESKDEY